jgi:hypothetical protein
VQQAPSQLLTVVLAVNVPPSLSFTDDRAVWEDSASRSINDLVWQMEAPALQTALVAPHDFLADECQVELWSTRPSPATPVTRAGHAGIPGGEPAVTARQESPAPSPE